MMLVSPMMSRSLRLAFAVALTTSIAACEARVDGLTGTTRNTHPITAPTGSYNLVAVNDTALPHATDQPGTSVKWTLVIGTFALSADSSWNFSMTESKSGTNGVSLGDVPTNLQGTWQVSDTTITLKPASGTMVTKGDTLFWRGGPKHAWEDSIKFTLVRK